MLDLHRNLFRGMESKTAEIFAVFPFTPNQYTGFSILMILVCDYFIFSQNYWAALLFFAVSSALDFVDGAVARKKNLATKKGAYWDTVADRYVEAVLLFGLLFAGLPIFYLPASAWIFLALFGSMMTTYAKAAAKEKELSYAELKGGLMSRAERLAIYAAIIVLLGLSSQWAVILLAILAVLANFTALQRIANALR